MSLLLDELKVLRQTQCLKEIAVFETDVADVETQPQDLKYRRIVELFTDPREHAVAIPEFHVDTNYVAGTILNNLIPTKTTHLVGAVVRVPDNATDQDIVQDLCGTWWNSQEMKEKIGCDSSHPLYMGLERWLSNSPCNDTWEKAVEDHIRKNIGKDKYISFHREDGFHKRFRLLRGTQMYSPYMPADWPEPTATPIFLIQFQNQTYSLHVSTDDCVLVFKSEPDDLERRLLKNGIHWARHSDYIISIDHSELVEFCNKCIPVPPTRFDMGLETEVTNGTDFDDILQYLRLRETSRTPTRTETKTQIRVDIKPMFASSTLVIPTVAHASQPLAQVARALKTIDGFKSFSKFKTADEKRDNIVERLAALYKETESDIREMFRDLYSGQEIGSTLETVYGVPDRHSDDDSVKPGDEPPQDSLDRVLSEEVRSRGFLLDKVGNKPSKQISKSHSNDDMYHALGMVMLGIYISRHTTSTGLSDRERLSHRTSATFTWWKANPIKEPDYVIKQDIIERPYSYKNPSALYPTDMFPNIHYMKLTQISHINSRIEKLRTKADEQITARRIEQGLEYDRATTSDWLQGLQSSILEAKNLPNGPQEIATDTSDSDGNNHPRDSPAQ